jgi:pyruvate dehydrogenase E2 component (dihydrolipoamide acetyltransferase)
MTQPVRITMPRLSDSMEEGTLLRWIKGSGEMVQAGDALAEIEFDKATTIHEADAAGVLSTVIDAGDTVPVGTVIAWIGGGGAPEVVGVGTGVAAVSPAIAPGLAALAATARPGARPAGFRPKASPVARRMAAIHGIELDGVAGSGPDGRIMRSDVAVRIAGSSPEPVVATGSGSRGEVTTQVLSHMQALVAERMTRSHTEVPDFEVRVRVDAEPMEALRRQLKPHFAGAGPSINDFVVKAAGLALREHPRANGSHRGNGWELYGRVNVGIAVATDGGLVVPTVFDADQKSLSEISRVSRDLSTRARAGRITPSDLDGATFTVSNLGMFGVDSFTAVVPPNQGAILAVGAVLRAPVVRGDAVVPGLVLELVLSCDHRILYGADAARLVTRMRELLEQPLPLLVR